MFKNIIVGALVGAVLVGAGVVLSKSTTNSPSNTVVKSVVGDVDYFPCKTTNGFQSCSGSRGLGTATTTVCAFQSPTSTSTLSLGGVRFNVGSTTNMVITLAKSASAFATTTILTETTLAANAQGTFMSTSTPLAATGLIGNLVFAPNQWFVVGIADATPEAGTGTFSPTGSCSVKFDVI